MCTVSMIGDHYSDKWRERWGRDVPTVPASPLYPPTVVVSAVAITRAEFDALRRDVQEMKELLRRAKIYDAENGEPGCEMDEKVALLKKVAELVGVDLADIFDS